MIATATTLVMFGRSALIRQNVGPRSRWLSTWARPSANNSWGTVASTRIWSVLNSAFQKYGSASSSR
jgi:hypothetical protein